MNFFLNLERHSPFTNAQEKNILLSTELKSVSEDEALEEANRLALDMQIEYGYSLHLRAGKRNGKFIDTIEVFCKTAVLS